MWTSYCLPKRKSSNCLDPDELTVYQAMGHACEDMAAVSLVYQRAKQNAAGRMVIL